MLRVALILVLNFATSQGLLAQPHSKEELVHLFGLLGSRDLETKNRASRGLLTYSTWWIQQNSSVMRESIPALLTAVTNQDSSVRVQASGFFNIIGLFRARDSAAILDGYIKEMLKLIEHSDQRVQANLMGPIALFQPSPPAESVRVFMQVLSQRRQGAAAPVAVFGLMRAAPDNRFVAEAVLKALGSSSAEVRRALIQSVASAKPQHPHPLIVQALIEQLSEDSRRLRQDTVRALGAIGPDAGEALPKLREIAENPKTDRELRINVEAAVRSIKGSPPFARRRQ